MREMESRSIHTIHPSSRRDDDKDNVEEVKISRKRPSNVVSMCGGDGDNSYSSNSLLQRRVLLKAKPILVKATREMVINLDFPKYIKLADFGCSSGPNTFITMSEIVNTINVLYEQNKQKQPEIDCCLNDLADNDFNTTFKFVPFFNKNITNNGSSCFVSGVPGSFYSRLFPLKTLHFVHSSYSLHWTSKVPDGVEDNKWGVYLTTLSPLNAYKLYLNQFRSDFTAFLEMRSKEMVSNGRMVLTLIGRNNTSTDPLYRDCCHFWTLLSKSLRDLVSEGVVSASKVDSFNVPFYDPSEEELKEIVKSEGSFEINDFEIHGFDLGHSNHDQEDYRSEETVRSKAGQKEADCIRAISEPMLVAHFGHSIIDALFTKYANHVTQHATCRNKTTVTLVVSLVRT